MRLSHTLAGSALMVLIAASAGLLPATRSASQIPGSTTEAVAGGISAAETTAPVAISATMLGTSGNLRAFIDTPEALTGNPELAPILGELEVVEPGVHALPQTAPDGAPLVAITLAPLPKGGRTTTGYRLGEWPTTGLAARNPNYAPPAGYISVTPENREIAVSKRFRLRDFLTKDQHDVWPKALVLRTRLVDKLELVGDALDQRGLPSKFHVMSGFRTPQYNEKGVGKKGGRASNSRHMHGDAADVFVDADGNGQMDDLNGDGTVNLKDAKVLLAVAEEVEAAHPNLVGGMSAYPANSAHGPFVHIDTRGSRARW